MATTVHRLGGVCTWRELRRAVPWRTIGPAVAAGTIVRPGRGVYALPAADEGRIVAARLTGVASHRTAALHHGWKVKATPALPDVTIPRHRKLRDSGRGVASLHWRDLGEQDISDGWVTTPVRTVIDCCLDLPFDEALAVFDSALRGGLSRHAVQQAAPALGPRHRRRVLAVDRVADGRAANPFESVLRAIALDVPGLAVSPQTRIRYEDFYAKVDLADETLQIVLEADSFEFHGERAALSRDCRRYDELTARDWIVLRFTWEQVMFDPEWVLGIIAAVVAVRRRQRDLTHLTVPVTGTSRERASA